MEIREHILQEDREIWVDPVNGRDDKENDDKNDGSVLLPYKTIKHALNQLPRNLGGRYVSLILKDGTHNVGSLEIANFICGTIQISNEIADRTRTIIKVTDNITITNCDAVICLYEVSLQSNVVEYDPDDRKGILNVFCSANVLIQSSAFGDIGNGNPTIGILAWEGSYVNVTDITDIDVNKVTIGAATHGGLIISAVTPSTFGDTTYSIIGTWGGLIVTEGKII